MKTYTKEESQCEVKTLKVENKKLIRLLKEAEKAELSKHNAWQITSRKCNQLDTEIRQLNSLLKTSESHRLNIENLYQKVLQRLQYLENFNHAVGAPLPVRWQMGVEQVNNSVVVTITPEQPVNEFKDLPEAGE
jgi:hypothetical protein